MKLIPLAVCLSLCLAGCSLYKKGTAQQKPTESPGKDNQSGVAAASPHPATEQTSPANEVTTETDIKDDLHTPAKGTPEREAIMEVLRAEVKKETGEDVVFVVNILKVHNGWAWVDVTPNRKDGTALYEGKESLMHQEKGVWKDKTLPPQDSDDDQRMFGDLAASTSRKFRSSIRHAPRISFPSLQINQSSAGRNAYSVCSGRKMVNVEPLPRAV